MKKIYTYLILALATAAILAAGCSNPFITPKAPAETTGDSAGLVLISLEGTQKARTLLPSIVAAEFYYAFTFTPDPETGAEELIEYVDRSSSLSLELAAGNWTLDVKGYIDADHMEAAPDDPGVIGSETFTVDDKGEATVTVDLAAVDQTQDGVGEFVYTVSFPANVASAELSLINITDTGDKGPIDLLAGAAAEDQTKTASGVVTEVFSGFYRMVLDLTVPIEGIPSRTLRTRVVRIHDSLQTKTTELFTEEDFFKGRKFDNLRELKTYLDGLPANDTTTPYAVALTAAVDLSHATALADGTDVLGGLYGALTRYVDLDLSECTGTRIGPTTSGTPAYERPNAPNLVSVTLPSGLTTIGHAAFYNCTSLSAIDFSAITTLYGNAFQNSGLAVDIVFTGSFAAATAGSVFAGTNITSITFTNTNASFNTIPGSTFAGCEELTTVTLPASRTNFTFSSSVFSGCTSLTNLNWDALGNNSTVVEGGAFRGTAFSSLPSFAKFKKSGGLPTSSTYAQFSDMPNLTSVDMSGWTATSATLDRVFSGCVNLGTVTLPPGVTTIAGYFSLGCTKIRYDKGSNATFTTSDDGVMLFKGTILTAAHGATGDVTIPATVTAFSSYAFAGAPLTKVDMSACTSLVSIGGQYAFSGCTALVEVVFSAATKTLSNNMFRDCTALVEITLPSALTSPGGTTFQDCSSLAVITLPSTLTGLGDAFKTLGSANLLVKIPKNLTAALSSTSFPPHAVYEILPAEGGSYEVFENGKLVVQNNAVLLASNKLSGPLTLPASITSIKANAFQNHTGITSVDMSACTGLTTIGQYAFEGADVMTVSFPASLTAIHEYAFQNSGITSADLSACTDMTIIGRTNYGYVFNGAVALSSVKLPPNLTDTGIYTFQNATALSSVTFPASLKTINTGAFYGAAALTTVSFPASLTTLTYYSFQNSGLTSADLSACTGMTGIGISTFSGCAALASVSLPPSCTAIGGAAFKGTAIRTITMGENTTSIGVSAFEDCAKLEWVKWPMSGANAYVGASAFKNAAKLSRVELPDAMQSGTATTAGGSGIGASAFAGTALRVLILNSGFTGLPADYANSGHVSYAFPLTEFTIYVPNSRVNTYKSINYWNSNATLVDSIKSVNTLPAAENPDNWL